MSAKRLVTHAFKHKFGVLRETWKHRYLETLGIHNVALSLREHLFAGIVDLLDSTVVKFEQLTLKHNLDILFSVRCIDLL